MVATQGHRWMRSFKRLTNLELDCLVYSGLWKIQSETSISRWSYVVYKLFMLTAMYVFAITLFADICLNIKNLSVATDDGCIFAGIAVVIFKAMNYQFRRRRISKLIEDTLKCADDLCEFSNATKVKDIIDMYHKRNTVIFYGFSALGSVLVIALLLFSPMDTGLPIRAKYPFDTTAPPWRHFGLSIETCAVSNGMLAILAMDNITVTLCSLLIMQFDILNVNFENCGGQMENVRSDAIDRSKTSNNVFLHRYKACLRFQQRLVCIMNDYNRTYSSSMFVQMLSSTSIICLTGFQAIVVGGQSSDIMKFGIYLSAAISQLLYICWIGNELNYSSSVLDRSQWLSDWHHENFSDVAKVFTLSTMFTRQPITLKAGAFYVLSLQTFIAIIRRSYSVFTLLNNMHTSS